MRVRFYTSLRLMQIVTLAAVATEFLSRPGSASSTQRSYESTLLPLLDQYGQTPIEILTRPTLEEYLNSLTHLAYTTHRRHQAIVQSLFNFALERGHIRVNPIAKLKQRQPDSNKDEHDSDATIRYLSEEQLQNLYNAVQANTRMNALVHLLHQTGARISEILALDLAAIDQGNCKFQVIGKGNKQRWCFYSLDAAKVLERYLRYDRHPDCAALFTAQQPISHEVSRLSYAMAYKDWKQLTQKSHLTGIRLHDLRHTFATERVGLMGIEELRALMGHERIQTTLRYQKVTLARAEVVAKRALSDLAKQEK
jgi:integrase/recombinase XerD